MHDWVATHLRDYRSIDLEERHAWWITLKWYFGYCARKVLRDPAKREHGRLFWRDAVLTTEPEEWQRAQWAAALKWFFDVLVAGDRAGPSCSHTEIWQNNSGWMLNHREQREGLSTEGADGRRREKQTTR